MLETIADLYQQFLSGLPEPVSSLIDFVVALFPKLLEGAFVSVQLLLLSGVVGNLLALPVALARVSRNPLLRVPSYLFILLMRGTPLLVQIYILYYGLGHILGQIPLVRSSFLWRHLDAFWYAAAAFAINTAGYSGEILRGAILAVAPGEIDAARAFGMSKGLILRRVILPQAIRISLPTFSGETIALLKVTAIASTITVYELLRVTNEAYAASLRFDECYISAAIVYIALSYVLTRAFYFAERQINKDRLPPRHLKAARPLESSRAA
jgi:His/Glu/Gln/Arg/opine family amino acid ABC transporter permease subunit